MNMICEERNYGLYNKDIYIDFEKEQKIKRDLYNFALKLKMKIKN